MTLQLRAHFDGRVIVPDETVDIRVNQPLTVQVSVEPAQAADPTLAKEAFEELKRMAVSGANISAESLRREKLYRL